MTVRRTDNDLAEAIRLKRVYGGKRVIRQRANKGVYSLRDHKFVELNTDLYREKCLIGGATRT